ncbi:hypothetical protein DFJ73DRAFT_829034 [Zopfochytrium polystomum]|nr:hypothetical protein DFJ73DRAFT_829034 [Zopfochytrium polystomum]
MPDVVRERWSHFQAEGSSSQIATRFFNRHNLTATCRASSGYSTVGIPIRLHDAFWAEFEAKMSTEPAGDDGWVVWPDLVRRRWPDFTKMTENAHVAYAFCKRHGLTENRKTSKGQTAAAIPRRLHRRFAEEFGGRLQLCEPHPRGLSSASTESRGRAEMLTAWTDLVRAENPSFRPNGSSTILSGVSARKRS